MTDSDPHGIGDIVERRICWGTGGQDYVPRLLTDIDRLFAVIEERDKENARVRDFLEGIAHGPCGSVRLSTYEMQIRVNAELILAALAGQPKDCLKCEGTGYYPSNVSARGLLHNSCPACHGSGKEMKTNELQVSSQGL